MVQEVKPWEGSQYPPRKWQAEAFGKVSADVSMRRDRGGIIEAVMGSGKSLLLAELAHSHLVSDEGVVIISTPTKLLVQQLTLTLGIRCGADNVGSFFSASRQHSRPIIVACNRSLSRLSKILEKEQVKVRLLMFDEAHRSESGTVLEAVERLNPESLLGFSATPYRSISSECLSLYSRVLVSYSFADAIRDNVLVPFDVVLFTPANALKWDIPETADRDTVVVAMIKNAEGPGVVSADSIDDAELFQSRLSTEGIAAAVITGLTLDSDRIRIMQALKDGALNCVIHINVLTEGADFPFLQWLVLRRTSASKIRFPQEIGRVLRTYPGKFSATVYDPNGLTEDNLLINPAEMWKPTQLVSFLPENKSEARLIRRWIKGHNLSQVCEVAEGAGFDVLMESTQREGAKIKGRDPIHVLVANETSLSEAQIMRLRGCMAEVNGKEEGAVRLHFASRSKNSCVVWLPSRKDLPKMQEWAARTNKTILSTIIGGDETEAGLQGLTQEHKGKHTSNDAEKIAVFDFSDLGEEMLELFRLGGRKVVQYAEERITSEAEIFAVSKTEEVDFLLRYMSKFVQRGFAERFYLKPENRNNPQTWRQRGMISYHIKDIIKQRWNSYPKGADAAILKRLLLAGKAGTLNMSLASYLIIILNGAESAKGWI